MTITLVELQKKIKSLTGLLLTHSDPSVDEATEIWIKFRNEGHYVMIRFEDPIPENIELQDLVGAGNALNCSEKKKDMLTQYDNVFDIRSILQQSVNYKNNMDQTVLDVLQLFDIFTGRSLYQ